MIDLTKRLFDYTGSEFVELLKMAQQKQPEAPKEKRFVYGISGLALLFNCSKSTAINIKKSGMIDRAIKQYQRTIIVDAELALELFKSK